MSTLADLLLLKVGSRISKILVESWLGKDSSTVADDVVDVHFSGFQSAVEQRKARREFEALGEKIAEDLLPLFERASQQSDLNAEAVILQLEATLAQATIAPFIIGRDLAPEAIISELRMSLPRNQYSEAEERLYELALKRTVRRIVEIAPRLPRFQEAFAARVFQDLRKLVESTDDILSGIGRIETTVSSSSASAKIKKHEVDYSRRQKPSEANAFLSPAGQEKQQGGIDPTEGLFDRAQPNDGAPSTTASQLGNTHNPSSESQKETHVDSILPIKIEDLVSFYRVEADRIEFKAGWNEGPTAQQILKTICAFANDFHNVNGGYIVVGVEASDGTAKLPPIGINPDQIESAQRWIRGHCSLMEPAYVPRFSHEILDGKHLLVIWAQASDNRPHSVPKDKKGERCFYVRLGAETVQAKGPTLYQLLQSTTRIPFDDQRALNYSIHDLKSTLVREYLRDIRSYLIDEGEDLTLYHALRLTGRVNNHEVPRNVGLLFFHDTPERIFPGAQIDLVLYEDGAGGDVLEERIFRGPLHRQVRDCLSFLKSFLGRRIRKVPYSAEAPAREVVPFAAIEEALVNAVHHRDYQHAHDPTKIYIYPDGLEITSYPGPVPGLAPDHFQAGRRIPQVPARNRRIGEFLKELRLAEARSTGIAKIFRAMAINGSPTPEFRFDSDRSYFTVFLPAHLSESIFEKPNRYAEYEIDYRLAVLRNLDYVELFGIDLRPESRRQKLSATYITLSLLAGGEVVSADNLFENLPPGHEYLLVRGEAGSGKSTLLRWAAIQAAAGDWQPLGDEALSTGERFGSSSIAGWRNRIPFLVPLRHSKTGRLPSVDELPELISGGIGKSDVNWVKATLDAGLGLLLLDGIDEIPNAFRDTVRREISNLTKLYPGNCFIVSTRPRAVEPGWLADLGFREALINPMSELDRSHFIDRWHSAVASELAAIGRPIEDLESMATSLKGELAASPPIARLATNPLLCAMVCALHRDRRQKLPERQRDLCEALCEALVHRRERESGLDLSQFPEAYRRLDYPQKRAALQELAHHMVLNGYSSISAEDAQDKIGLVLRSFPGQSAGDARVVTESLVERSGILREETPGTIGFVHAAFKELLAGDYFADQNDIGLLAHRSLDPDWQPTILFAVGTDRRSFASRLIRTLLDNHSGQEAIRPRQIMALRCRAAALFVDEDLDQELQNLASELFPPHSIEDAEALASYGEPAVPFLYHEKMFTEDQAVACIRTLRLIGTSSARVALRTFLEDRRPQVVNELAQAVNPLEIAQVLDWILAGEKLPHGISSQVADISPLASLSNLQSLGLSGTRVADISPLASLSSLQRLDLSGTLVADVSPLASLSNLQSLDLRGTQVADVSPLVSLSKLESLDLRGTKVADVSPLASLTSCTILRGEKSK